MSEMRCLPHAEGTHSGAPVIARWMLVEFSLCDTEGS